MHDKHDSLKGWYEEAEGRLLDLPGTGEDTVEAISSPHLHTQMICLTMQHRFAFYFWASFFDQHKHTPIYGEEGPILVSIDYHYDVGNSGTLTEEDKRDLERLDLGSPTELGLYCWLRLNANNDTHIQPALYMSFFSDAYVLLKKSESRKLGDEKLEQVRDRFGRSHKVKYFTNQKDLIRELRSQDSGPIYLDIDLDYFVKEGSCRDLGTGQLVDDEEIRRALGLGNGLMSSIFPTRIVGLTIALEPRCCGGARNSMHVLNILNEEFFAGTLFTKDCNWNFSLADRQS